MIGLRGNCPSASWSGADFPVRTERRSFEQPEAETIRRAQQGDAVAFEEIYQLHSGRVYALCLRMVRNPMDAEDLTQEAFLRVFRKLRTFRGDSAFPTWLYRLAFNVVLMRFRKKSVPEVSMEDPAESNEDRGKRSRPSKEIGGNDAFLDGLIDRVHLERAMEQLPENHKIVFVLHDVQGYKHAEIAKIMEYSVGTSKVQLHRARTRLRDLLRQGAGSIPIHGSTSAQTGEYTA